MSNSLNVSEGSIDLSTINDNFIEKADTDLAPVFKNLDKKIKYITVLSQEDFGKIEPDNDTIYFINNLEDDTGEVTNILDVAVSHTSTVYTTPEYIWVLTSDLEMQEVRLWKSLFSSGNQFKLVKKYVGYVDGRLTFDGIFTYSHDYEISNFITNKEPFVVLINTIGELYAFPSLKYKTTDTTGRGKQAIYLDGDSANQVLTCSVEKGYCSELLRGDDQGVIVAYSKYNGINYDLYCARYGYATNNSTVKTWTTTKILTKPDLYHVSIRRLSDYRVGLTYNYYELNDQGQQVSRTEFRYSKRIYSGVAFHPEYIDLPQEETAPSLGTILYGAVRNDNIDGIERPHIAYDIRDTENLATEDNFRIPIIFYNKEHIDESSGTITEVPIELLDIDKKTFKTIITANPFEQILQYYNFKVVNTWPFQNYQAKNDPDFKNAYAAAEIECITVENGRLNIIVKGNHLPMTPFTIVPIDNIGEYINLRYSAEALNQAESEEEGTPEKNMSGWFALENILELSLGEINYCPAPTEVHDFLDYQKDYCKELTFDINVTSVAKSSGDFSVVGFGYSFSSHGKVILVGSKKTSINFDTIQFRINMSCSSRIKGVTRIDV